MNRFGTLTIILVIALILSAGCTQPALTPQQDIRPTTVETTLPATTVVPTVNVTTSTPKEVVTVIRYVAPVKTWKNSDLHFGFDAPQDWAVTTRQLTTPDGSQGLEFQTDLLPNDRFYIRTYPVSRNQDQDYRNTFRKWVPAPDETTATYNNIVYDRFESVSNGRAQIAYVARKSSASDIGYASVLVFTTNASHSFQREDFENVVASFTHFSADKAPVMTGYEIPRAK
jgi:hypothetical protein